MNIVLTVLLVIILLLVIYYLIAWLFGSSTQLTSMMNGNEKQTILAKTISNNSNSSNFAYSTWFFVNDWNYRFGEPKVLLGRLDEEQNPSPSIAFDAMENNITISVSCYPSSSSTKSVVHQCNVKNFPLQKWVNLIVSVYGRTLDVYIDGKLVRTCVLPGVVKVDPNSNILVTPNGGFNGWTSNFKYFDRALNPQEAYNTYKDGFGGSILGNMFNKYRIKIAFLSDNKEQVALEI